MSRTGMPANPLEVRRSLPKLCLFSILWLPIMSVGPVMVILPNDSLVPDGGDWVFGIEPLWWLAVAVSAYACWHFFLLWKALGTRGIVLRLAPEGLVMPSLGSGNPIPWHDVEASNPVGLAGMMGFILDLKIDPKAHTGIPGASALLDDPTHRGRMIVRVPSVLSVSEKDILGTVRAYKDWAAKTQPRAQNSAAEAAASAMPSGFGLSAV